VLLVPCDLEISTGRVNYGCTLNVDHMGNKISHNSTNRTPPHTASIDKKHSLSLVCLYWSPISGLLIKLHSYKILADVYFPHSSYFNRCSFYVVNKISLCNLSMGRDNSVGILTRYGLDVSGF
jgi:hypothetical protein